MFGISAIFVAKQPKLLVYHAKFLWNFCKIMAIVVEDCGLDTKIGLPNGAHKPKRPVRVTGRLDGARWALSWLGG